MAACICCELLVVPTGYCDRLGSIVLSRDPSSEPEGVETGDRRTVHTSRCMQDKQEGAKTGGADLGEGLIGEGSVDSSFCSRVIFPASSFGNGRTRICHGVWEVDLEVAVALTIC